MIENRQYNPYEQANSVYQEARIVFEQYLNSLNPRPSYQTGEAWENLRNRALKKYGDESIISLYPEELDVNTTQLLHPIVKLWRMDIKTKDDLMKYNFDREELYKSHKKRATSKVLEVAQILQDLAIAEKYREWNSVYK